ncbi:MAG: Holliday junction branch migration protein RuvA [Gemmatimonadota bacterium]
MIALLAGTLASRRGDTLLILTDGGVGYAVTAPLGTLERLPPEGSRVILHTELVVREDGWFLYGFDQPDDRAVFATLLSASGFGPRLALALLSTLGPGRTVRSIRNKDLTLLSTVSGIGRKKAERLVLELRDKFEEHPELGAEPAGAVSISAPAETAVKALVRLGYSQASAEEAVRAALTGAESEDTALLVRKALARLGNKS